MDTEPRTVEQQRDAFVDALTTRLWSGTPLNEYDVAVAVGLARILGLDLLGGK